MPPKETVGSLWVTLCVVNINKKDSGLMAAYQNYDNERGAMWRESDGTVNSHQRVPKYYDQHPRTDQQLGSLSCLETKASAGDGYTEARAALLTVTSTEVVSLNKVIFPSSCS
jgi:hypothetical protein